MDSTQKKGGEHLQPIDLSDEIQEMISHAAMMNKRAKVNAKLSAYDPDPMSLDACKISVNWITRGKRIRGSRQS